MDEWNTPFLERDKEIQISERGDLPHWHQDGKIQYVTFRLADSLPQSKIARLKEAILLFEAKHPRPWSYNDNVEYYKLIGPIESRLLDNGYGECLLKDSGIRRIVSDSLHYFDGTRYVLLAYVIMPNHIHALLQMKEGYKLSDTIQSIKKYTSRRVNGSNRKGALWMKDYFDRIVRNEDELKHYIHYICNNPRSLPVENYSLYVR